MKLLWWNQDYLSFKDIPLWIKIAMPSVLIISAIAFIIFMAKPKSFTSGEDFAIKYTKIAGIKAKKPVSRFFWCAQVWPLDKKGHQILPYALMHFKRYLFIIDTLFWVESARWKQKGKKHLLYGMFLIRWIIVLFTFSALYSWLAWIIRVPEFQRVDYLGATFYLLIWSFGFSMIPAVYFSVFAAEEIYKMNISKKERDALMLRIKLIWLFPFAITIFETFRIISQIFYFLKNNKTNT